MHHFNGLLRGVGMLTRSCSVGPSVPWQRLRGWECTGYSVLCAQLTPASPDHTRTNSLQGSLGGQSAALEQRRSRGHEGLWAAHSYLDDCREAGE